MYIDLDAFKPVNDTYGHPVGDQILQIFAKRLQRIVRPTDAVARLGGDEFAIALDAVRESANAHGVAENVLSAAAEPFQVGELRVSIGASVGVAFGEEEGLGWRDLGARADARLYEAKAAGKGAVRWDTTDGLMADRVRLCAKCRDGQLRQEARLAAHQVVKGSEFKHVMIVMELPDECERVGRGRPVPVPGSSS